MPVSWDVIVGWVFAAFILGALAGHRFLPLRLKKSPFEGYDWWSDERTQNLLRRVQAAERDLERERTVRVVQRNAGASHRELERRYELFRQQAPHIDGYFEGYKPAMMKQYPGLSFEQARDLTLRLANGERYWE